MIQFLIIFSLLITTMTIIIVITSYMDPDFSRWIKGLLFGQTPIYSEKRILKAEDFRYLLSTADIWHLRRIASHYTSTKPMHSDPETTALAVTLKGLGKENQ